jgi:hypothetical protein
MKTYVHLWYHTEFFLEWEMFGTKVVEKIKTQILCSITFFRKSCRLRYNVEKYGRARQATDDNITRFMCIACWITKATNTHSEYVIIIAFPRQKWLRERASVLRYTYIACHCLRTHFVYAHFALTSLTSQSTSLLFLMLHLGNVNACEQSSDNIHRLALSL